MNKKHLFLFLLAAICCSFRSWAQVAAYTFTSYSGTFTSIVGQSGTVLVTDFADDQAYGTFPIGFTFAFNNNDYTTFGISANGFISMGSVPVSVTSPLNLGSTNNVISAMAADLYGLSGSGAKISYQTSGTAPNRILTVEFTNWGFFSSGLNEFSFQIRLLETSNKVQIIYGDCPGNTSKTVQVGLRGNSTADFNNRTTTTNWAATTAGTVNNATCTFNSTVKPYSGLVFEWTPPPPTPRTVGTITAVQQTGNVAPNTMNNPILRIDIPVTGGLGKLTLTSITVTSKNTSDADIAAGGVKIWVGTASGITTQISNGFSFSGGTAAVTGMNYQLISGTNYIYVTFDISPTAVAGNTIDARITTGSISITASDGANNPGSQPTTALNPNGSRTVGFCSPYSTYGGCAGDKITSFIFAGINYSTTACVNSPGYLDVGTTATVIQGQDYAITITCGDPSDYVSIWIDYNDNTSFDDAGELVFSAGPGSSFSGTIVIPVTAPVGTHRLRVRNNYEAPPNGSCGSQELGETKDFRVTVQQAVNCSGAPAAAITQATVSAACSGIPFTLSLSITYVNLGISYQWQQSANGSTFTDIAGATQKTFTTTQNSATYYRCRVTCTLSGQSTHSSTLFMPQNPHTACYCVPPPSDCGGGYRINSVSFGGMTNSNNICSANGYGNYQSLTATVTAGTAQPISVSTSFGGTLCVSVWIDYDHDAVFEPEEKHFIGCVFNSTISNTINIPITATAGITGMRVRGRFAYDPADPCVEFEDGETEDYLVNIVCSQATFYLDADGDGYGTSTNTVTACVGNPPAGYVSIFGDCNDGNAAIHPAASDVCNSIDDNCDNIVDENAFTATVTPSGTVVICDGSSVLLTANPQGSGFSYQWYKGSKVLNGATTATYSAQKDAKYKVTITSNLNCSSTSAQTDIDLLPKPPATITPLGNLDICQTGSVVLQANSGPGYTYQWKKGSNNLAGETNQTYTATSKGTYKVTVTDANGCSKTSSGVKVTKSCKIAEQQGNPVVILYPNPVQDEHIYLDVSGLKGTVDIIFYDVNGAILNQYQTEVGEETLRLSVGHLPNGMYVMSIRNAGATFTKPFVVQR
ncbi:MAG: GEVED domain-containing protein [Chitinophagales bacterium]|nr:GEVED domain-containing protein [Chitinophagales bacterium]MDW8428107.1 GEVED domain-containing protein [Chitinophagales bacterium]